MISDMHILYGKLQLYTLENLKINIRYITIHDTFIKFVDPKLEYFKM